MQLRSWDSHYSQETTLQAFAASLIYHWPYIWQICLKAKHSAIEIGCGRGVHSIFLSCFIPNVLGIDNNIKLVEKARKNNSKFHGHARFSIRDAFKLDFAPGTFDVCFSQGFLEHFSDEEIRLLAEKQLRIAKVMVASVPSALYAVRDRGDERLMRIEDWQQILKDFDMRIFSYGFRPREINRIISVKNLVEITKIVSSMSGKAHVCMVVKKATN
ncbi:MAG: class I SAM-dependent methyltransferase [Candidatus Bathyarchaeia archaeon]